MADPGSEGQSDRRQKRKAVGPVPDGQVRTYRNASGITTFSMRIRWNGQRPTIRLGTELEGWNMPLAELKLEETLCEIREAIWTPPAVEIPHEERDPTFHEFATAWLDRHRRDLDDSTILDYTRTLSRYILPEFRGHRLSEISYEAVARWRDRLREESDRLHLAQQHQIQVLDRNGRPKRPFGSRTINEAIRLLGQILDRAVESEQYVIERNPAKGRSGLRVKAPPRSPRNHLEADEVLSLIQAADLLDQGLTAKGYAWAKQARHLRAQGKAWSQIAEAMSCAETTAIYRAGAKPNTDAPRRRRTMIVMLALTGPRASEATLLRWDAVDETHGRIVIDKSKTGAGIREIQMSAFVREELALYKESLPAPPLPGDPVFPVRGGRAGDRHNLLRRLARIVSTANDLRREQGLSTLPSRITPHTFRRTFITLSFQAGRDLVFVQTQAGHADWKTTLEIYTQQSNRSVDVEIRRLLRAFLGENGVDDAAAESLRLRAALHARHGAP